MTRARFWFLVAGAMAAGLSWAGLAGAQVVALPPTEAAAAVPMDVAPAGPILLDPNAGPVMPVYADTTWSWQWLPEGLIYRSYLAGGREPRLSVQLVQERTQGWIADATLGGRVGLLRYGNCDLLWPEGWQLDLEGAAFPRLDWEPNRDLMSVDCRIGMPITFRRGRVEAKAAYYHLSSHLGDEFLLTNPGYPRRNYVRDAFVLGVGFRPFDDVRLYAEADWAFNTDDGARPWEFQFGAEYSPGHPSRYLGAPFVAVNSRLREEVDYSGNITVQAGWQLRGESGHLVRLGLHYLNGLSDQGQSFDRYEDQIGFGVWHDY